MLTERQIQQWFGQLSRNFKGRRLRGLRCKILKSVATGTGAEYDRILFLVEVWKE